MPSAPQKSQLINKQSLNLELYTPKSYKEIQNMEITRPKNSTKSSTPPSSAIGKKLEAQPTHIDSARIEKNKKITQKPPLSGKSITAKSTAKSKNSEPQPLPPTQKHLSREISYDILNESTQTTNTNLTSLTVNEYKAGNNNETIQQSKAVQSSNPKTNNFDSKLEINSSRIDLIVNPTSAKSTVSSKNNL